MKYTDSIVYSFCSVIIDSLNEESSSDIKKSNAIYLESFLFVKDKLQNSPLYIKFGLITLTLLINYLTFFRFGYGFSGLNLMQKKNCYLNLKTSRFSFKRDLLKFYQSFILLYINKTGF